jgi:ferritin-like metal-binding protein YciE
MKFFSENLANLRELYINQLQMLVSTEEQIIDALPKMSEKATDPDLKRAFNAHLQETRAQLSRVQQILKTATGDAKSMKCKALAGLVTEAEDMIKDAADESVRDAALISAAQRVEHYEIAVYGTLVFFAEILGETEAVQLLEQTLTEEKNADELLTQIADRVNVDAEKAA